MAGITPASRDEVEIEGGPDGIPEVLVDLVTAHIRSRPLTPAAVLATKRAGWLSPAMATTWPSDERRVGDGAGDVRSRFSELGSRHGKVRG